MKASVARNLSAKHRNEGRKKNVEKYKKIMEYITKACEDGKDSVIIHECMHLPNVVKTKLEEDGYNISIQTEDKISKIHISWEE